MGGLRLDLSHFGGIIEGQGMDLSLLGICRGLGLDLGLVFQGSETEFGPF